MGKNISTTTEEIKIIYQNKEVDAYKLTVQSLIPIGIDKGWSNVTTSELLVFVAKGKVTFKPVEGRFPSIWKEGQSVETRMLLFGILPFGGIHTLYFEKIDAVNHIIQTKENDDAAKVWNHTISLNKVDENTIVYKDEVIIYGGLLTVFITAWAKSFYIHRQKRWLLVPSNNLKF